ncbi:hypothetical protein CKAH01_06741 [Colletotrichum kahawae]|uniref:Uncharacterized protein n=1 Tax=Colletotrichum kahawae TaxID=34407 RepID=A0AAE0D2A8_COLKA|nr:hypothetical protein CKAH01_06741 [Colletotrichum kahawae]
MLMIDVTCLISHVRLCARCWPACNRTVSQDRLRADKQNNRTLGALQKRSLRSSTLNSSARPLSLSFSFVLTPTLSCGYAKLRHNHGVGIV